MAQTWDDYLKQKQEEFGLVVITPPKAPSVRFAEPKTVVQVKLYNIHKRSLPPGIDRVVIFGVAKEEGEWWIERKLKAKCFQNDTDDTKTVIFYDLVPVDATPQERSIYYNAGLVTTTVVGYGVPQRIN